MVSGAIAPSRLPSVTPRVATPFLKWAGGKGRLLPQLERFLPESMSGRGYVEPFMGSAALFFHVTQTRRPARCTLLDVNAELVNAFVQVRDQVEVVIHLLAQHDAAHNSTNASEASRQTYYYRMRAQDPSHLTDAERAARFIYLNRTCYNGLHRTNSRGQFNVPIGRYAHPRVCDSLNLIQCSRVLQDVTIEACEFADCTKFIAQGDFVYMDPPYAPLSPGSSFTAYSAQSFSEGDQKELSEMCARLAVRSDCMISNSSAPLVRRLYAGAPFTLHEVMAARTINRSGERRGKIPEVVITTYPAKRTGTKKGGAES